MRGIYRVKREIGGMGKGCSIWGGIELILRTCHVPSK